MFLGVSRFCSSNYKLCKAKRKAKELTRPEVSSQFAFYSLPLGLFNIYKMKEFNLYLAGRRVCISTFLEAQLVALFDVN